MHAKWAVILSAAKNLSEKGKQGFFVASLANALWTGMPVFIEE
jgi:hypothetical protein